MSGVSGAEREKRRDRTRAILAQMSARLTFLFETAIDYGEKAGAEPMAVPMLGHALREMTRILPRFVNIPLEKKRVEYPKALDVIATDWDAVDPMTRVLTARQFTVLAGLVTEHDASAGRARARATALARTTRYGAASEEAAVLDALVERWRKLERELPDLAHVSDDGGTRPADVALRVLEEWEALLDYNLAGFWDIDAAIKGVVAGGPSAEAYARAKALPKSMPHWMRLYDQLGVEWLQIVIDAGDFERPPTWVTRDERPVVWPALDYLQRVASADPDRAATALVRVPDTINVNAQAQVLEIAATLLARSVRPLAKRARAWVRAQPEDILIVEQAGLLMTHLASGGAIDAAFVIAAELLTTRSTGAPLWSRAIQAETLEPRIGTYSFGRIVSERLPALVAAAPARALRLLIDTLSSTLERLDENTVALGRIGEGRAADELVEGLVFGFYHGWRSVLAIDRGTALAALDDLGLRPGTIMRRLELALLGVSDSARDRLHALYRDRALFDDYEVFGEYATTMRARWVDLGEQTHEGIRQWIAAGPSYAIDEPERELRMRQWKRRWLAVIEDVLPPPWREDFADALTLPAPEQPTRLVTWTIGSGSRSPRSTAELQALSIDELMAFLNTWVPPVGGGLEPSASGLASELEATVAAAPERFLPELARLRTLGNDVYIEAIDTGLARAAQSGASLEWNAMVKHLEHRWTAAERLGSARERAQAVWGIVRLLEVAVGRAREDLPAPLRQRTFAMVQQLVAYGDGATVEADVDRQHARLRGRGLEIAVRYGMWIALVDQPEATNHRLTTNLDELGVLLAQRLSPSGEGDAAARAVLAAHLPELLYLDADWVGVNLDRLLPLPSGAPTDASWSAFLGAQPFTEPMYALLAPHFTSAVERVGRGATSNDEEVVALGMHLTIARVRGWDAPGVVFDRYLAVAPAQARRRIVHQIGLDLSDDEQTIPADPLRVLESFWQQRIGAADAAELRAFGSWFASGRFAPERSLGLLGETLEKTAGRVDGEREVGAHLHALAPGRLDIVLPLFERILIGLEHGHTSVRLVDDGRELVRLGLAESDPEIRERAERIRDRFGALGHAAFETVA